MKWKSIRSKLLSRRAKTIHSIKPNLELLVLSLPQKLLHFPSVRNSIYHTVYFEVDCVRSLPTVELILFSHSITKLVKYLLDLDMFLSDFKLRVLSSCCIVSAHKFADFPQVTIQSLSWLSTIEFCLFKMFWN